MLVLIKSSTSVAIATVDVCLHNGGVVTSESAVGSLAQYSNTDLKVI